MLLGLDAKGLEVEHVWWEGLTKGENTCMGIVVIRWISCEYFEELRST